MGTIRFKNFADLSFLQQVDKPRFLVPLLTPYAAYFRRCGLDVAGLRNSDEHDRQLLDVFVARGGEMPVELLETLYVLDDLADEAGHDLILAELESQEIQLRGILGEELSPGEFAIAIHCKYPQLVRTAHSNMTPRQIRIYEEYQAKTDAQMTLSDATAKLEDLEKLLGSWFESKNRSQACKIVVTEDRDDLWFEITHGRPFRMVGTINQTREPSSIGYRPQQHDSVIFEARGRLLKVDAQTAGERDAYRRALGTAFFEDEDHFPVGDIYSLELLRLSNLTLATVAGVERARLTELKMELQDAHGVVQVLQGHDLLNRSGPSETARRARGKMIGATFHVTYASGGPPRKLEIRPPNVAIYDRARDEEATEAFLIANRFLTPRS